MLEGSSAPEQIKSSNNPQIQSRVEKKVEELKQLSRFQNAPQHELIDRARSQVAHEIWINRSREKTKTAEEKAIRDKLTGLHNRAWFDDELTRAHSAAISRGKNLWIVMMDIDDFKVINDTYGHLKGDDVLRALGEIGARESEPISRYGGEEFAQIISDGLNLEEVENIIARYSLNFKEATKSLLGREATLSFGVAKLEKRESPETLVERADAALYQTKRRGKDQANFITGSTKSPIYNRLDLTPRERVKVS